MAKIKGGVNGSFSGKVGGVVGSSWNGIDYIRSLPRQRSSPFTPNELRNQSNLKLVHEWLQPLLEVVRVGFKGYSPTNYGYNAAKSYVYKNALVKAEEGSYIDPSLVQLSYGDLGISGDLSCELNGEQQLVFSWDSTTGSNMGNRDQVMLVAYDPETGKYNYTTSGGFRMSGSATLDLNGFPTGTYHIYAAFVAENRERQSHSVYLGPLNI